jgi:hypothetical protein
MVPLRPVTPVHGAAGVLPPPEVDDDPPPPLAGVLVSALGVGVGVGVGVGASGVTADDAADVLDDPAPFIAFTVNV